MKIVKSVDVALSLSLHTDKRVKILTNHFQNTEYTPVNLKTKAKKKKQQQQQQHT